MKKIIVFFMFICFLFVACETGTNDSTNQSTIPSAIGLGETYSLSGIQLIDNTNATITLSSFNGTVYADQNGTIQIGIITNGVLDLNLPLLTASQLWETSSFIESGLVFSPTTVKWFMSNMYVKQTGTTTIGFRINANNSDNTAWVKFIYANINSVVTGSKPDGTSMRDEYNLNLVSGWNWAEWGWPTDILRTCISKKSSTYTWFIQINN